MDRFDCQFLMATFVNVYIHSFINIPTPGKVEQPSLVSVTTNLTNLSFSQLLQQVFMLRPEEQLELFHGLEDSLQARGILQPPAIGAV